MRCHKCVCVVLRQHYMKSRKKDYYDYMKEWCQLNNRHITVEWKLMNRSNIVPCPAIHKFMEIISSP